MKKENTNINEIKYIINDLFKEISPLGSYQFSIIITILFFLTNHINEFKFLSIGFILMTIIVIPIRLFFFKERPDKTKYNNKIEKIHASSFPSMHATRTTFLVLFLIFFFNKETYISLFISIIGFLIIYSRIYNKRHYPIDIIFGILFGVIVYLLLKLIS